MRKYDPLRIDEIDLLSLIATSVSELSGENFRSMDFVNASYDLTTIGLMHAFERGGSISPEQRAALSILFSKIVDLQIGAEQGDGSAKKQLGVILKAAFPPAMIRRPNGRLKTSSLPAFDNLLENYQTSPDLEVAFAVRSLASQLSFMVQPICTFHRVKQQTPEKSARNSSDEFPIFLRELERCRCGRVDFDTRIQLRPKPSTKRHEPEPQAYKEARRVISNLSSSSKKRLTLIRLAKKVFLHRSSQSNENSNMTERKLDRALKILTDLEETSPDLVKDWLRLPIINGPDILYKPN
jgi:hypothetical protein